MIIVYTKPGCPYSRGLFRKLRHDGVEFIEQDAQNNPAVREIMMRLNGGLLDTPTILDTEAKTVTVGFHGHCTLDV